MSDCNRELVCQHRALTSVHEVRDICPFTEDPKRCARKKGPKTGRYTHQPQMWGYMWSVGTCGIQPKCRPAEYDHSSACSAFQVHCIQPLAFSNVMTFRPCYQNCAHAISHVHVWAHLGFPYFPQKVLVFLTKRETFACHSGATPVVRSA